MPQDQDNEETKKFLRNYIARNTAVTDSSFNIEAKIRLLTLWSQVVDSESPKELISEDELKLSLKLAGALLAQEVLGFLEEVTE
jgi:hypothetical protein